MPRRGPTGLPLFARLRGQIPLVLLVGCVLPALIVGDTHFVHLLPLSAASVAFYASLASSLVGLALFRRLGSFPGITSLGQVAPAVVGPYTLALLAILIGRLPYSRPVLLMSAALCAVVFYGLWLYCRRRCSPTFYLLPKTAFAAGRARVATANVNVPLRTLERNAVIVADFRHEHSPAWQEYLLNASLAGIPVYHSKQLQESLLGQVEIEHLSENTFGAVRPDELYTRLKRGGDVALSIGLAPLLAVVFLLVALAIKLDSPGPVFFVQRRRGHRGEIFKLYKFRSMQDSRGRAPSVDSEKTRDNDPRVTRVGRFLRRYRIDELPQVLNVLRGEMSWIGPRPEACELSAWYQSSIAFYGYRHLVRPGITGWAQVHQGHVHGIDDVKEKLQYDFYYIKNFSWWLDALIVLRTVRTLVFGNGAR